MSNTVSSGVASDSGGGGSETKNFPTRGRANVGISIFTVGTVDWTGKKRIRNLFSGI